MWENDSEQVLRRKDEKHFGKRDKRPETVEEEAVEMNSTATRGATCAAP